MSIFATASMLREQNINFKVIAVTEDDKYIELWLKLLGTAAYVTKTAQRFHWNVRGRGFDADHKFFGSVYDATFALQDLFAEHSKTLDHDRLIHGEVFSEQYNFIDVKHGTDSWSGAFKKRRDRYFSYTVSMLRSLRRAMLLVNKEAESQEDVGGQNLLQGQIEALDLLIWKAKASLPENSQI